MFRISDISKFSVAGLQIGKYYKSFVVLASARGASRVIDRISQYLSELVMNHSLDENRKGVALVTGGSRGIGRAIAVRLACLGYEMVIWGRDADALAETISLCGSGSVTARQCELGDVTEIEAGFAALDARGGRLSVLVNNAGIGVFGPCDEVDMADWDRVMAINVKGAFACSQLAFRRMKAGGGGRIVNVASVVGVKGYANQVVYAASKHALMGITKVMAREGQAHNIRVHAVCPGGVATDMVAQARPDLDMAELIQPDDVADAVAFLVEAPSSCVVDEVHLRRADSLPFA